MADQLNQGPQQGERRSDPHTGETRVWSGTRWESNPISPVGANEPDTYLGGFLKGGMQSLGDSKGRLAALGGLLGSTVGAPNIGAMAGTEVGNLAERMGGGDNTLLGDAARVGATGAAGYAGGKVVQGAGWLANKMGAGNAALSVASHLPIVGKYARLAQMLGAAGEAGAPAEAAATSTVPGLAPTEAASLTKQGYSPELQARIGASAAPRPTPAPTAPAAPPRPVLSRPVAPYTMGNDNPPVSIPASTPGARQVPMNLDRLSPEAAERIPLTDRSTLPSIGGKTIMPNLSQTPSLKYGADVSTAGDWHAHVAPQALKGLEGASTAPAPAPQTPRGLDRWVGSGGDASKWQALQEEGLGAPHGFGPNTVGAAEKPQWLPKTVDEAKGLSLLEQEAWEGYKRANPGVTDSMLNSWYTQNQMGADPNAHLDLAGKVDKLRFLLHLPK